MPDIVRNGDLSIKQRIDLIKRCLMIGGVDLLSERMLKNSFYLFEIFSNGKKINLSVFLKNITNSGWSDKPLVKRIQVKSFKLSDIETNTRETCSMFLGMAYANETPIFVAWNPFMFVYHNTVRSCYIDVELIARAQHEGIVKTISSKQRVIISDANHFCELISTYIDQNAIDQV